MSVRSTFVRSFIVVAVITLISSAFALLITHPAAATLPPPPHRANDLERLPRLPDALTPDTDAQSVQAVNVSPWYRVAFQSARDDNWEIYFGNDDGSGQTRLTYHGDSDIQPRLNRGATRIVFASRRSGNYDIYTMNVDGSGVTRLTTSSGDDLLPYWSPDGSRIVFQSTRDGQAEVYVMNANGSGQTRLTFNSDYDGEAAWSPDGTRIVFVSKRTSGTTDYWLWTMNADGSNQQLLANQPYCGHPVWSPSGTRIAYDASGGDYWQNLWIVNADSSNAHQVFDEYGQMDTWAGSWSPNEQYIAITRIYYTYYQGQLYWTEAYVDGFDPVMGFTVRLSPSNADWRPDWQSLDITPPTASLGVPAAPARSPIGVTWSATDAQSGVGTYDVQVREGAGGSWTDWQSATTATSAQYAGIGGHTYYFRVRARDQAGNVAAWSAAPQANTTVEALPPTSSVGALPAFVKNQVTLQWNGSDPGGSGIETYDVQYRDGVNGAWTGWLTGTLNLTAAFSGESGHTYFFRARAIDKAQNLEGWPAGDGDASTQFYVWAISGLAKDNTGTPVSGITVATQPVAQATFTDDPDGLFTAYVVTDSMIYTTTWSKSGYGGLPPTPFEGGTSQPPNPQQGVLPAQDNGGPAFVTVSNLTPGQRYRVIVKGTWEYTYGVLIDAQWARHPSCAVPTDFCYYSPNVGFNGVYRAAQTGQTMVDPNHEYTYSWLADSPTLQLNLGDSQYWDNSGALTFEIFPEDQDRLDQTVFLPPADNVVLNGDFEAPAVDAWLMQGAITPTLANSFGHTGQHSLQLGSASVLEAGDSAATQVVTLTPEMSAPVLSFLIQPREISSTLVFNQGRGKSIDRAAADDRLFSVQLLDALTTTTLYSATLTAQDWTHHWFDLSPWAGQLITLTFSTTQVAGASAPVIYLDEISVGSAMPDVWVQAGAPTTGLRATSIVYQLTLGNQGGAPANGVMVTATLPADVTFVDASLPPVSASPVLTWNLGDFTGKSTPVALLITATIAATATNFSTLTADFEIGTTTGELERANNVARADTFVGLKVFLPVMQRQ